jgi:hypothetical protein
MSKIHVDEKNRTLARHCVVCGNIFWAIPSILKRTGAKFCSMKCSESLKFNLTVPRGPYRGVRIRRFFSETSPKSYKNQRKALIMALGGKCCKCGYEDFRALELDHIRGGGSRLWREDSGRVKREIAEFTEYPDRAREIYQVLCCNCNRIKKYENKEGYRKYDIVDGLWQLKKQPSA